MHRESSRQGIEMLMNEIFGENAAKAVLFHASKLAETSSVEEFLLKIDRRPELLFGTLTVLFEKP